MAKRGPWSELTAEELRHVRRRQSLAKKRREMGLPNRIPTAKVGSHIRMLRASGASMTDIAQAAGVCKGTLHNALKMKNEGMNWRTGFAILAVEPMLPAPARTPHRQGSPVDQTGTTRRLRALHAMGYTSVAMAAFVGSSDRYIREMFMRPRKYVFFGMARDVATMYDKLADVPPLESGYVVTQREVTKARAHARKQGFAPPECWDADTIDDPEAFPEWTGACGTRRGAGIHRREGTPECRPCLDATNQYEAARRKAARAGLPSPHAARRREFDRAAFSRALNASHQTREELAERTGMDTTAFQSWESGRTLPKTYDLIDRVATALGRHPDEFYKEEDPT